MKLLKQKNNAIGERRKEENYHQEKNQSQQKSRKTEAEKPQDKEAIESLNKQKVL